jgi:putative ABC transport system permease protein
MRRNRLFTGLNIFGLTIGLACSILILLWVQDEWSYDRFTPGPDRIFRLVETVKETQTAMVPTAFAATIKAQVAEVKRVTRIYPATRVMRVGALRFVERRVFHADTNFLRVFNYPLVRGDGGRLSRVDKACVLASPDGIVLTETTAIKYFGSADGAMDRWVFDETDSVLRRVTGVLADVPGNSHLQFDVLLPVAGWDRNIDQTQTWRYFDSYTYVQLADGVQASPVTLSSIASRLDAIRNRAIGGTPAVPASLSLQSLTDIHLRSHYRADLSGMGNIAYVRIFLMVAILILLIACVNFMNLATALSGGRAKEVGLRKTLGAFRLQLVVQFMGESMLLALISLGLALVLVYFALPFFNDLAGKAIRLNLLDPGVIGRMLGIAIATGLIAGCYPAIYLSSFNVIEVIKGRFRLDGRRFFLRNGLVIFQFSVAVILMISTVVIYRQLRFIHDRDPGFDRQRLLYVGMPPTRTGIHAASLKAALRGLPFVDDLAMTWALPTQIGLSSPLTWRGMDKGRLLIATRMGADDNYIHTMGMKMAAGRFYTALDDESDGSYVINEMAARAMGVTPFGAIGKLITINGVEGTVIGVVKDFNFKPVYQPIEPLVLKHREYGDFVLIRVGPGDLGAMLSAIRSRFQRTYGDMPFSFGFLDQDMDRLYAAETRLEMLFRLFSILAIVISCLGLFGLATFATRRRTREIGVRKVLGAGEGGIVLLLVKGFLILVVLSLLVAFPIAWFAMHVWLQGFAYRVSISLWTFAVAGLAALMVAFVTVGYQTVVAARANPVKALRGE